MNALFKHMRSEWAEPFLQSLLDACDDAVTMVDTEGVVIYWNQAAERTYGIDRDDIVGRKVGDFFQRESIMLFQVMESGQSVHQIYHEPRPGLHVMINTVPVHDNTGHLIGAVSMERNVSSVVKLSAEMYSKSDLESLSTTVFPFKPDQFHNIMMLLERKCPILFTGRPGSGRRVIAHWLHKQLHLQGLFATMNCSAIPAGLLEAELFGYEGESMRSGKLEQAADGLLFIQNIDVAPIAVQEKLAHALSENEYSRVGGHQLIPLNCRVIGTISAEAVAESKLSNVPELSYAFQQFKIPSLMERKEEMPELCRQFIEEAAEKYGFSPPSLRADALTAVASYDWPGNLPQLRNAMEHASMAAHEAQQHYITVQELPEYARLRTLTEMTADQLPLSVHAEEVERTRITEALNQTNGNKAKSARILGISRGALYYKLKQYGLDT